jgi:hypothetical protein
MNGDTEIGEILAPFFQSICEDFEFSIEANSNILFICCGFHKTYRHVFSNIQNMRAIWVLFVSTSNLVLQINELNQKGIC